MTSFWRVLRVRSWWSEVPARAPPAERARPPFAASARWKACCADSQTTSFLLLPRPCSPASLPLSQPLLVSLGPCIALPTPLPRPTSVLLDRSDFSLAPRLNRPGSILAVPRQHPREDHPGQASPHHRPRSSSVLPCPGAPARRPGRHRPRQSWTGSLAADGPAPCFFICRRRTMAALTLEMSKSTTSSEVRSLLVVLPLRPELTGLGARDGQACVV